MAVGAELVDVCPEVEAAVIANESDGDDAALLAALTELSDGGDTETQNALRSVLDAVEELAADREPADLQGLLDAQDGYSQALAGLADRCQSVGSSALQ